MSAIMVVNVTVKDPEKMKAYSRMAPETVERFGGKFLGMGKKVGVIGEPHRHEVVGIAEFPDMDAIHSWYHSEEYQALLPIRDEASETHFVLYEKITKESWMAQDY